MIEIFQVDAFADRPFAGNPAAVCSLAGPADAEWMQHVATEMNLSETAFFSRFFSPQSGIDEDPVTGSAHCQLAPYWCEQLGKSQMLAYQASARGGVVRVAVRGDRVELGGRAVTVMEGKLR